MQPPWLLVSGDFTLFGGMDQANYRLAWFLAENLKRRVTLVAHRVAEPLASHPLVRVVRVRRPFGRHLLGGPLLDWAGRRAAGRLTAADATACVLINGGNCYWPGVNWVHMVHHACPASGSGGIGGSGFKHWLTRALFRRQEAGVLRQCPLVIANSHKTKKDLIEHLGLSADRARVVYLGVDAGCFDPPVPADRGEARRRLGLMDDDLALAFVGVLGFDRNKGFDTLLAACRLLAGRELPSLTLLAAGGGQLEYWRGEAAALGLGDRVRLLGAIDYVPDLLAAADLLVSPTRYDAYGLAVHEALCRGTPAIVSRAAGIAERYPSQLGSLLLDDPNSAPELARRIVAWFGRRDELRPAVDQFGAELRAWTWDDMSSNMVEVIEGYRAQKRQGSK